MGKGSQVKTLKTSPPLGYTQITLSTLKALRSSAVKNHLPRKATCLTSFNPLFPKLICSWNNFFQVTPFLFTFLSRINAALMNSKECFLQQGLGFEWCVIRGDGLVVV